MARHSKSISITRVVQTLDSIGVIGLCKAPLRTEFSGSPRGFSLPKRLILTPVKISFLSAFNPYRGGISQFSEALFHELDKEHQCKAWTFTRQYPGVLFPGKTQFDDSVKGESHAARSLDSIMPASWKKTGRLVNLYKPDWHVNHFWMPFFGPAFGRASKVIRPYSKVATIVHNLVPHEGRAFDKQLSMKLLRQSQAFITMSSAVTRDVQQFMPDTPVLELYHPLYEHFGPKADAVASRENLGLPKDAKVLLFFGFIRDYKGLDVLLDAFGRLGDDYWLVIAGESYGSFNDYQASINKLPNRDKVIVHQRYIAEDEVRGYWAAADLAVLPYKSATQSGITSIAFHFDTPVCVTDVGGLKETVEEGETGVVAVEPDGYSVSLAVERFFGEYEDVDFEANISSLKERLSWSNYARQLIQFLEDN